LSNIKKGIEFASQTQIINGSQKVSNLEVDVSWEFFNPKLLANQICGTSFMTMLIIGVSLL
jgi:hypothetical protein